MRSERRVHWSWQLLHSTLAPVVEFVKSPLDNVSCFVILRLIDSLLRGKWARSLLSRLESNMGALKMGEKLRNVAIAVLLSLCVVISGCVSTTPLQPCVTNLEEVRKLSCDSATCKFKVTKGTHSGKTFEVLKLDIGRSVLKDIENCNEDWFATDVDVNRCTNTFTIKGGTDCRARPGAGLIMIAG